MGHRQQRLAGGGRRGMQPGLIPARHLAWPKWGKTESKQCSKKDSRGAIFRERLNYVAGLYGPVLPLSASNHWSFSMRAGMSFNAIMEDATRRRDRWDRGWGVTVALSCVALLVLLAVGPILRFFR